VKIQRTPFRIRYSRYAGDEVQNRVVSPWQVPLLGWHAGKPAGSSGAKRRASWRTDRAEETATAQSESAGAAAAAAAAAADKRVMVTLMHDVEIKRKR